jgi:intraflagellar transport protein 172
MTSNNIRQYDNMIRLVSAFHKDHLEDTHAFIGKALEADGHLKEAEVHYIEGHDWKSAVSMWCANNEFEEAYRVAKINGGSSAAKQIAYLWAKSIGGDAAIRLLNKFGLLEAAVDFAVDNHNFEYAFELATGDKTKLYTVYFKYAEFLNTEGKHKEASLA